MFKVLENFIRLTVAARIIIAISALLASGVIALLAVYYAVVTIDRTLHHITDVEEPASAAAYEMEINAIGTGLGVLKYLDTGDPKFRERVEKDEDDFRHFKTRYDQLADTPQRRELGTKVNALFQDYKQLGALLMDLRDRRKQAMAAVADTVETLDRTIDDQLTSLRN